MVAESYLQKVGDNSCCPSSKEVVSAAVAFAFATSTSTVVTLSAVASLAVASPGIAWLAKAA